MEGSFDLMMGGRDVEGNTELMSLFESHNLDACGDTIPAAGGAGFELVWFGAAEMRKRCCTCKPGIIA